MNSLKLIITLVFLNLFCLSVISELVDQYKYADMETCGPDGGIVCLYGFDVLPYKDNVTSLRAIAGGKECKNPFVSYSNNLCCTLDPLENRTNWQDIRVPFTLTLNNTEILQFQLHYSFAPGYFTFKPYSLIADTPTYITLSGTNFTDITNIMFVMPNIAAYRCSNISIGKSPNSTFYNWAKCSLTLPTKVFNRYRNGSTNELTYVGQMYSYTYYKDQKNINNYSQLRKFSVALPKIVSNSTNPTPSPSTNDNRTITSEPPTNPEDSHDVVIINSSEMTSYDNDNNDNNDNSDKNFKNDDNLVSNKWMIATIVISATSTIVIASLLISTIYYKNRSFKLRLDENQ